MSRLASNIALASIHAYRAVWHRIHRCLDWAGIRFRVCHYDPSCSQYALDAFERYPARKAFILTWFRVWRCHRAGHFHVVMPDRLVEGSAEPPRYEHCCGGAMQVGNGHVNGRNGSHHSANGHKSDHHIEVSPEARFKKSSSKR
ncbi:membrane protein insertion efficiency factor YidD [bacterium]|nr:membrane protein insertion efficiency factor YidD [bacterium]